MSDMWRPLSLLASILGALGMALATMAGACDDGGGGEGGGGSGGAGGAGGCPVELQALLNITIRAEEGNVPPDTTVRVTWSVGEEPVFRLDDTSTWKALDESNLVCVVGEAQQPPVDVHELRCQIWTSGPTRVEVSAEGFAAYDQTLTPPMSEACEGPVPLQEDITLSRDEVEEP
ncbi:hypothetical protein [Chondromyces apiculatus]|uniref:hypothetical protein n=1 Tax=Chondromyces apiculatus TaxID=51 RepID=UPI000694472B